MRNTVSIIALLLGFCTMAFSQAPQGFSYQSVLRNNSGQVLTNTPLTLYLKILTDTPTGAVVYSEKHALTTNTLGLVNVTVGKGSVLTGNFAAIAWGTGNKYLQVDLDVNNTGSSLTFATTQLLSVPYALYAEKSGSSTTGGNNNWLNDGKDIYNSNTGNVGIGAKAANNARLLVKEINDNQTALSVQVTNSGVTSPAIAASNNGSGSGVSANSESGDGLSGTSNSGYGIRGYSTSGIGGFFTSSSLGKAALVANGKVGINTENPLAALHIQGNNEILRLQGTNPYLQLRNNSGVDMGYFWQKNTNDVELGISSNNPNGRLFLGNNNRERMTLLPNGNVGINTSLPSALLHIQGNNEILRLQGTNPFLQLYNNSGTPTGYFWQKGIADAEIGLSNANSAGKFLFSTAGLERMAIYNNGNIEVRTRLGIGLIPSVPLDVNGNADINGELGIEDGNGGNHWSIRSDGGEKTGVGAILRFSYNNNSRSYISNDDREYHVSSDARLKTKIQPYPAVLPGLKQLKVCTYNYKNDPENKAPILGLVAQNVEPYFPEIVGKSLEADSKEVYLSLSYSKFGVIAIKAIQEQQDLIEQQAKRIDQLEARLAKLEEVLSKK